MVNGRKRYDKDLTWPQFEDQYKKCCRVIFREPGHVYLGLNTSAFIVIDSKYK
jgi:hypothetical protein